MGQNGTAGSAARSAPHASARGRGEAFGSRQRWVVANSEFPSGAARRPTGAGHVVQTPFRVSERIMKRQRNLRHTGARGEDH